MRDYSINRNFFTFNFVFAIRLCCVMFILLDCLQKLHSCEMIYRSDLWKLVMGILISFLGLLWKNFTFLFLTGWASFCFYDYFFTTIFTMILILSLPYSYSYSFSMFFQCGSAWIFFLFRSSNHSPGKVSHLQIGFL